jgi:hypothetical protein
MQMGNGRRHGWIAAVAATAAAVLLVGCTPRPPGRTTTTVGTPTTSTPGEPGTYRSPVYSIPARWRCRPDTQDLCDPNLDITEVHPDGSTTILPRRPATDAAVDCFYIYPTISTDLTPNADWNPSPSSEDMVIRAHAAQMGTECRMYAPLYRQATLTFARPPANATPDDIPRATPGGNDPFSIAYRDVADAFKHYLANDNGGRGFVIFGHSQGAGMLTDLLHWEIEPKPEVRARMVSAMLIGAAPRLGPGANDIKACTSADQTGCVVSYSSYSTTNAPTGVTMFAGPNSVCTNPAALGGGRTTLGSLWTAGTARWSRSGAATRVTTDFVTTPGLVTGECVTARGVRYFSITFNGNPADPRVDTISGDSPGRGLHTRDVGLALGDLVQLVRTQSAAYAARG